MKTISFVKGKGSIAHNNRDFIAENVDRIRTEFNEYYKQEPLEKAYEHCFGQALKDYNAKQTRKDRKKGDYITEIKHSGNGEKLFYENVVQIGDKNDTGFFREDDPDLNNAYAAAEVLREYARTFQERNPNLYLFNAVLHMDEATPHLHLDYIPVAHGYKRGMETRNSLTKALQQIGIPKAVSHDRNETVFWQEREREYIKELCLERGIEIYEKGIKREDLSLPEYKDAMRKVEKLDEKADIIKEDIEVLEEQVEAEKKKLEKYEIRGELLKKAERAVKEEKEKGLEPMAKPITDLLGKDTGYVKVEKKDWLDMKKVYKTAKMKIKLIERYEGDIGALKNTIEDLRSKMGKCQQFLKENGLLERFIEYLNPHKQSLRGKMAKYSQRVREEREFKQPNRIRKREDMAI